MLKIDIFIWFIQIIFVFLLLLLDNINSAIIPSNKSDNKNDFNSIQVSPKSLSGNQFYEVGPNPKVRQIPSKFLNPQHLESPEIPDFSKKISALNGISYNVNGIYENQNENSKKILDFNKVNEMSSNQIIIQVIEALTKVSKFYAQQYQIMNFDAIFGLKIVEGKNSFNKFLYLLLFTI